MRRGPRSDSRSGVSTTRPSDNVSGAQAGLPPPLVVRRLAWLPCPDAAAASPLGVARRLCVLPFLCAHSPCVGYHGVLLGRQHPPGRAGPASCLRSFLHRSSASFRRGLVEFVSSLSAHAGISLLLIGLASARDSYDFLLTIRAREAGTYVIGMFLLHCSHQRVEPNKRFSNFLSGAGASLRRAFWMGLLLLSTWHGLSSFTLWMRA